MSSVTPVAKSEKMPINRNVLENLTPKKISFRWIIDQYSVIAENQELKSPTFIAVGDGFKWHLEHHVREPQGLLPKSVFLDLVADSVDDIRKYGPIRGNVEFSVKTPAPDGSTYEYVRNHDIRLDYNEGITKCVLPIFALFSHVKQYAVEDELTIFCKLEYVKKTDFVFTSGSTGIIVLDT